MKNSPIIQVEFASIQQTTAALWNRSLRSFRERQVIHTASHTVGRTITNPATRRSMIQQRSFNNQSTTWRFSPVRTVRIMVTVLCAKVVDVETVSVGGAGNFAPMSRMMSGVMVVVLGLFLAPLPASAFHIHLHGLVTEYFTGDQMKGVQVRLVKDSIERETVITSGNGRYELYLERGYNYVVWFHRNDMVTKHVRIDARDIPLFPDVPFYDMDLQITLFQWIEGFDFTLFDAPIGMAAYKHSVRNLNWDIAYNDAMRPKAQKLMVAYEKALIALQKAQARAGSTASPRTRRRVVNF